MKIVEGEGDWESQGMTKVRDLFRKLSKKGEKSLCLEPLERKQVEKKVEIAIDAGPQGAASDGYLEGAVTY